MPWKRVLFEKQIFPQPMKKVSVNHVEDKFYYSFNMFQLPCMYQVHNVQISNKRHLTVYDVL